MKKKLFGQFSVSTTIAFLIVLIVTLVITQELFFEISFLKEIELKLIDKRFYERGTQKFNDEITICTLDQESFEQLPDIYKKYPLNRKIFAKAIDNLNKLGAKVIGIDVIMSSFDQFSKYNDEEFINSLKKFKNVVLAGKIDEQLDSNNLYEFSNSKLNYNFGNVYYDVDSSIGIVRVIPDIDNVYRRYSPAIKINSINKLIPSFGFAVLNKYFKKDKNYIHNKVDNYFIYNNIKIPAYDKFTFLINFYGPNNTFKKIKLIDVIDDEEFKTKDEENYNTEINNFELLMNDSSLIKKIKNKIVLIGSTIPEDRDLLSTSISLSEEKGSNIMYGVEFHANAIQNVIDKNFISKLEKKYEIILVVFFTIISFWTTYLIRKIKLKLNATTEIMNLLFVSFLLWLVYSSSFYLFKSQKILIETVPLFITIIIGYFGSTSFYVFKERKQSQFIKNIFSQYVSKQVVNELISNADKIKLGGEKKNITIMFCDIVGFTSFAENKEPEILVKMINNLLSELTNIILMNNGTLDKYMGDAIMAFWGAPIEYENHAYLACKSAIEMQKKVNHISEELIKNGEQQLRIRIGINTGYVIVGNVGGDQHKNYTVMGDDVNLASRLEGANKEYCTLTMIGDSTYEMVKNYFIIRELDLIKVKGKTKPTKVYELIGFVDDEKAKNKFENLKLYFNALDNYKKRKFDEALILFEKSYLNYGDIVSKVFAERCKLLIENPPDKDWDGVFKLTNK